MTKKNIQSEWKSKTLEYAKMMNAAGGDEFWETPPFEDDGREELVPQLIEVIRAANKNAELEQLRKDWPFAYGPIRPFLRGSRIPKISLLEDGSLVAKIGAPYKPSYVIRIKGLSVDVVADIEHFGKSPNGKYFAYPKEEGISITKGWLGEEVTFCPYPIGTEGSPPGYKVKKFEQPPVFRKLIPFPDGSRVLFISTLGIFVLSATQATRLLPSTESMKDYFGPQKEDDPDENEFMLTIDMEHGAISNDGKWIAVGYQDSRHCIFNEQLEMVGEIEPMEGYPHYAIFSRNGETVVFNSCYFHNGSTLGVSTSLLPGLEAERCDERIPMLEDYSRIYAGVHRQGEFIIGNADGHLRAFDEKGEPKWQHYIGANIESIDISSDEKTLVCSTSAGSISIMDLDAGKSEEYEIGNGGHTEKRRWFILPEENLAW